MAHEGDSSYDSIQKTMPNETSRQVALTARNLTGI